MDQIPCGRPVRPINSRPVHGRQGRMVMPVDEACGWVSTRPQQCSQDRSLIMQQWK